ncbi:HAD family hydrolase [Legionella impletisoli]|uniref:Haloacid dehalogenase n=1 Tax=Legionella impletisoli TaxID=343510 RepID=A0A917JT50_9GAMM|nr:HAD-IA family hydrolase [Legionella impletisoli]GGI85662.1 haloacid dehalogenase [Legionella impletisoli]
MNSTYRLVVFDWEGTLGDTLGKVLNVLNKEAERMNLGEVNEREARKYLVHGLAIAIKKIFPEILPRQSEELLEALRESLAMRSMDVYLLPGAEAILKALQKADVDLAIATNRGQQSLHRDLQASGLEDYFTVTRSAGQVPAKPCPQMLEEIMEICGVTQSETLMIGDSVSDIEMATCLNVRAIGVNFYNQPDVIDELLTAGAEKVFDDYHLLAEYLQIKMDE